MMAGKPVLLRWSLLLQPDAVAQLFASSPGDWLDVEFPLLAELLGVPMMFETWFAFVDCDGAGVDVALPDVALG